MIKFNKNFALFFATFFFIFQFSKAENKKDCSFVIVDLESGQTIKAAGDCKTQESPCSTFKIALSLMGFDSGILKNENEPEWEYKNEYDSKRDLWKNPHNPKTWLQNSCVWYSQVLTQKLGIEKLQNYVKKFEYGNQDISGNLGKNDGLTKSWLCSSLKISPLEQVEFLKKFLNKKLPVSDDAYIKTHKILPSQDLENGWKLFSKTGGGVKENSSIAWLVGWATNEETKKVLMFASLVKSQDEDMLGNKDLAKQNILDELNKLF